MQTLRRIVAILTLPAIAWLGAACERTDAPTGALLTPVIQSYPSPNLIVDDDHAQCSTATFTTIQAAINAASPNQVILVCAGNYPELLTGTPNINKTLTLLCAQNTVDARFRSGLESIISDMNGTRVSVNNVVIDGFTVENSINPNETGYGIHLSPGVNGTQILNNIIQDNIAGIGLANGLVISGPQAVIRHNLIQNNNQIGAASGSGIYTDEFVGGATVTNVLIEENAFKGNLDAGIDVSNTDPAGGVFNLDVSTNSFDMNGRAVVFFNTHNSSVHNNRVTNSTLVGSAAIRLFDNNTNLSIMNNDLVNGLGHAIRLSDLGLVGGPSSGVVIHENNIEFYALTGLTVDPGAPPLVPPGHAGTVDATCNWWNSPSGPFNATENPMGTGEEVVGDADFNPWLIAPAPTGKCLGGVPSTPGKVTGGGQVEGDPVFAVDGVLLSLPALVPSLADPSSQANFGFVVQQATGGGMPTGNLEYNDKAAGVRIKATSFSKLVIGTGMCGTNTHATIIGTATVIRSTGPTNESLTVDVDDCGQSGSMDKFGIMTDTYSNEPPSMLIAGNITIH